MQEKPIIGRGTWIDKVAARVIEREKALNRSLDLIRTESGLGASGIPHIGSMADAVRAHAITLALRDMGYDSELMAFSDDMDGLRKVPAGMPDWLNEYLLKPVSSIPDPFGNYDSYADRMSSMLREALDIAGIEYTHKSGRELYSSGELASIIHEILKNASIIGDKIKEITGQEKFLRILPYFPICKNCGRIYTSEAYGYDESRRKVTYRCVGIEMRGKFFDGCGYEGEADITRADGKLPWKVEFAARWKLLDIRFEAYGKDIADSVKINDWVSKHILNFDPPMHVKYEMFLDSLGRKISKSTGNVFTPQMWFKYATPQSLILLILKRSVGTRHISPLTIPRLMDELDYLEDVYFNKVKVNDKKEEAKLKGLYEYCHNLKPPKNPSIHIPYRLLIELAHYSPLGSKLEYILSKLQKYGYKIDEDVRKRVMFAINFVDDFGAKERRKTKIELSENERRVINDVLAALKASKTPDEVQASIFDSCRRNDINPPEIFRKMYMILFNRQSGPRLGTYLFDVGYERIKEILSPYLENK
ncbi:MAG: lysine--tRNA ligase [Nitrososphaerota archaeon]